MLSSRGRDDRGAYTMFIAIVAGALTMMASVAYDVPRLITARQHAAQTANEAARVAAATIAAGGTLDEARDAATARVGAFPQPYGAEALLGRLRCVGGQVETTLLTSYDNKSALGIFRDTQAIHATGAAKAAIVGPAGTELALGALPQCPRDIPDPATIVPLPPTNLCVKNLKTNPYRVVLQWDQLGSNVTGYEYQTRYQYRSGNTTVSYRWGPWLAVPASALTNNYFTVNKVQGTYSTNNHLNNTPGPYENLRHNAEYRFRVRAYNDEGPSVRAPTTSPWFVRATAGGSMNNNRQTTPACGKLPAQLRNVCIGEVGHNSVTFRPYGPVTTPPNVLLSDSSIVGFAYTIRKYDTAKSQWEDWPDGSRPFQTANTSSKFATIPGGTNVETFAVTHEIDYSKSKRGDAAVLGAELQPNTTYEMYLRGFNSEGRESDKTDNAGSFEFVTGSIGNAGAVRVNRINIGGTVTKVERSALNPNPTC